MLNNDEIREFLVETAANCKENDGWIHFGAFGAALNYRRFNFKHYGFEKLSSFLYSFPDLFEIHEETSYVPPVYFIRVIPNNTNIKNIDLRPPSFKPFGQKEEPVAQFNFNQVLNSQISTKRVTNNQLNTKQVNTQVSNPKQVLFQWAWMGDFLPTIERLSKIAINEQWYYGKSSRYHDYPILSNYLIYTFYRLKQENKVVENRDYAAFNTGLADKKYKAIYALFKPNTGYSQPWAFIDFCVEGEEWAGKQLVANFKPLPQRAQYFNDTKELFYDTGAGKPSIDDKHIFIENTYRLPHEFLQDNCPKGFKLQSLTDYTIDEKKEYFAQLGKAIEADERTYRYMRSALDSAVDLAVKRVEWNFRMAIPMYYPNGNRMMLLLPLSLATQDKIDIALVVERTNSGNYLGHTLLPLMWAYTNARLISRPEIDWLVAREIEMKDEESPE